MKTKIMCPACNKAYLRYYKTNSDEFIYPNLKPLWRCEDDDHISFYSEDLHLILKAGGFDIDSVNYPKRLHITAEGVTAG